MAESSSVEPMAHLDFVEYFKQSIKYLVKIDPILSDLHSDATLDEVESLLALERGQAITVYVEREPKPWKIVVPHDASVHQLKTLLKRVAHNHLRRKNVHKKVSWKYVWRTYWLCYDGLKLTDDNKKLSAYGIVNKSRLKLFKKKE